VFNSDLRFPAVEFGEMSALWIRREQSRKIRSRWRS